METKTKDMKLFHKLVRNLQILYFDLEFEVAVLISLVHTFNFGFALKIALFDEEVIAADFMISQILSIFSPIGISPNHQKLKTYTYKRKRRQKGT
jgi:hypothetical protein